MLIPAGLTIITHYSAGTFRDTPQLSPAKEILNELAAVALAQFAQRFALVLLLA